MREIVAEVAGPRSWGDTRESWLNRAAERAGITYSQVKRVFYGEITDPDHKAARKLRDIVAQRKAAKEAAELASQFESIARKINATDQDFHRDTVAALVDAARKLRGMAGPRDGGPS